MDTRTLLDFMNLAEKLKCRLRHSWTSDGRQESVADHTFRLCMFAWLVRDEIEGVDMDRVMQLCLFHDIGEAVTGDIPAFEKTEEDRRRERDVLREIPSRLPQKQKSELESILNELEENKTPEAKLLHALDKMEALIQHNEASTDTWLPLEYDLQMTYGETESQAFPYTALLREKIREDSREKIRREHSRRKGEIRQHE